MIILLIIAFIIIGVSVMTSDFKVLPLSLMMFGCALLLTVVIYLRTN